tara:strand:+ start:3153 stop:3398 length:246 start_codon:yes stop_codon:yes gene_type:complete
MSTDKKKSNFISLEPEWHGMFNFAISLTKDSIPKDKGMDTVIEMLKFGQRLYAENKELKQQRQESDRIQPTFSIGDGEPMI